MQKLIEATTLSDWVRVGFETYGPEWVINNYRAACTDLDRAIPYTSFRRTVNHIKMEWVQGGKTTSLGDAIKSHEVDTADKSTLYHDVDPLAWRPKKLRTNTWGSPTNPNQQVRIEYDFRDHPTPAQFAAAFDEAVRSRAPRYPAIRRHKTQTGLVAEPCLYDIHAGRSSWGSSDQMAGAIMDALADLMRGYKRNSFDRVIFPIGNDALNFDNWQQTTTAGTPAQGPEQPDAVIAALIQVLTSAIDYLANFGDVDVIVIPGNHDWLLSHMLGRVLSAWYRESKNVIVDDALTPWKFRTGPGWLLGLTHGKEPETRGALKPEQLAAALPIKAAGLWKPDQYREVQTGHLHHKARGFVPVVADESGVVVRRVGSLAPRDAYERANLYTANREAELIVFDARGPRDYRSHRP